MKQSCEFFHASLWWYKLRRRCLNESYHTPGLLCLEPKGHSSFHTHGHEFIGPMPGGFLGTGGYYFGQSWQDPPESWGKV